ncbi:hypothetical protein [Kamptonema sp. UHCC 0994]|uniref:hypothetical protein n=1 Tax=Kamptonema sp. UHCC 0994 TaxID=3031329 RepID=UPI0023BAE42B|nr:hypothetical protein [Kamptonema sp. UHCC 0994]MDF0556736.1 hypothetical protein [Kamptonema sp. UHCC 0994]
MFTNHAVPETEYADTELNTEERVRLQELESVVEQGLQTFYEVGVALDEIRENKLYRETHKTFEAYCREKWAIARRTADQFIAAARVIENLSANGAQNPTSERQVRPLTGLPPELQRSIWQEAVESSRNGIPSGAAVQRLVEERVGSEKTGRGSKTTSELDQLRSENQRLKDQIKHQNIERDRRSAAVALELEKLRSENRQLKAELRQRDLDWEVRLASERVKIREEVKAELTEQIRAEVKAEYEGQINDLKSQVNSLTQQLAEMTANYQAVLARLEAIEGAKK